MLLNAHVAPDLRGFTRTAVFNVRRIGVHHISCTVHSVHVSNTSVEHETWLRGLDEAMTRPGSGPWSSKEPILRAGSKIS